MATAEPQPPREMLTVDEVAEYLRVSRATICRWCGTGKLPAFKIGKSWRVQKKDLESYIYQQRLSGVTSSAQGRSTQSVATTSNEGNLEQLS